MLSITTKSPYAIRALAELARTGGAGPVPIGELARRRDVPVQFLEQLFAVLRRAGILRSQRGTHTLPVWVGTGPLRLSECQDERPVLSITTKSPYAIRALAELARCGGPGPVPIGELARRRDVPVQFLEQLFAVLRRAGILRSQRGVKGGYAFAREPAEVTVLEVVELLDGRLGAEAEGIFAEAAAAARAVLAKTTIADVVDRENQAAGAAMYYI